MLKMKASTLLCFASLLDAQAAPFLVCDSYPASVGVVNFQIYFDGSSSPVVANALSDSLGNQVLIYDLASLSKTTHTAVVTAINAAGAGTPNAQALSFNLATPTPSYDYLIAPTKGSVLSGSDVWSFGLPIGNDYNLLINGSVAAGGYAVLILKEGGTIQVLNSSGQWWQWTSTGWTRITQPGAYLSSDFSAANVSGILNDSSGEGANAWTWGNAAGGGQYQILRDSVDAGGGYAKVLIHQGDFIIYTAASSGWWAWNGQNATSWTPIVKPPAFP